MKLSSIDNYEILEEKHIEDVKSDSYYLRHKKSGARIAVLSNDDENKVFSIAFRTPPRDSTGLPHILEHSVLCGSEKYPVKDPFVELAKGSLNTFLNAMTYPDKTVYPVASCNDKDFQNLMSVYMDAVFYPNIYKHEEIFRQEGWHYELDSKESDIKINGVVYNEMKGAFSSPESVLEREIMNTLYPDTAYGFESGGDPKVIPELSYQEFLDFHSKYYHPVNSYIYLYGNMDIEEKLKWLDEEYLSKFDKIEIDSELKLQEPFKEIKDIHRFYPVTEDEPLDDNSYLAYTKVIGEGTDKKLAIAFSVLDYALLSAPGAPIRKNLLKAGVGKDIMGYFEDDMRQPYFTIISKNANAEDKAKFVDIITSTLEEVVKEGLNKKAVEAALNSMEFKFREADYGNYPKGLMYGLQMFSSWLYCDEHPFTMLEPLDVYDELKKLNGTGYFEKLIEKYLLKNTHGTCMVVEPKQGMNAEEDAVLAEKLAKFKESMSVEEIEDMVNKTKALKEYQKEPSPEEDMKKIPLLKVSDIKKEILPLSNEEREISGIKVIYHPVETNGIAYLKLLFNAECLSQEEIQYASLLKTVLSFMDTNLHSYDDLSNEINRNSGGMGFALKYYSNINGNDSIIFSAGSKALYSQIEFVLNTFSEIIHGTDFSDDQRFYEIIAEIKSKLQMQIQSAGHGAAATRALAYFSKNSAFSDYTDGIGFYRFIKDIEEHYDEKKDEVREQMKKAAAKIFTKRGLFIDLTASEEGYSVVEKYLSSFVSKLSDEVYEKQTLNLVLGKKNEGFKMASQIQYVARCGNFVEKGLEYTGHLRVLKNVMSYEYLWNQVRVLGGAYGCMNAFKRQGDAYFVSYRDPNLEKTNEVYEKAAGFIANADFDYRAMTKFIIGTVSDLDTPLNPSAVGARSFAAYMQGITEEMIQKERDEVLSTDLEKLRSMSKYIEAFIEDDYFCVLGNEEKIEKNKNMFLNIETL